MCAVPIIPAPDGSARRTLTDPDGVPVAHYTHAERDGRVVADLLELELPVERALPVILAELRGMRVAGPRRWAARCSPPAPLPAGTPTCTRTTCASGPRSWPASS